MPHGIKFDRALLCGLFAIWLSLFSHSATSAVAESLFYTFSSRVPTNGLVPFGALIQGKDGNLYGVTSGVGGGNYAYDGGAIFKLSPSGVETVLHNFPANSTDGFNPQGGLIQGSDGALYGTTASGGTKSASHGGTIFKITPSGEYTQLYSFSGPDGEAPRGTLLEAPDGNFYGVALGGANGYGTVFKMTPAGTLTTVFSFGLGEGTSNAISTGVNPAGGLVLDTAGNFYGVTYSGGTGYAGEGGVVFKLSPNFVETVLHSFSCGTVTDGCQPEAALTLGSDGNLYGTTSSGGVNDFNGTVFQVTPDGVYTVLHFFKGGANNDGAAPAAVTLVEVSPETFYGTTGGGGVNETGGTVFQITSTGQTTILYSFPYIDGASPIAGVLLARDGSLYGPLALGPQGDSAGAIFKLAGVIPAKGSGPVARGAQADYLGEGKADYTVWRPLTGYWYSIDGAGNSATAQWGAPTDLPVIGDFDGDGKSDFAVFRPATGFWYIKLSSDSQVEAKQWGAATDVPVAGDFDGDGKTDLAVYRPTSGYWYVIQSSDNTVVAKQFGEATDIPVVGDFDGDGKSDIAVYRPSTGYWYITQSSTNTVVAKQWGEATDIPATGDYDGDGKSDIAVYRPSTGYWYIIQSSNGQTVARQWGAVGDVPVARDYDGDGKTDIAVWRPSSGFWYVIQSSTGNTIAQEWGAPTDISINSLSR